jgi:hypothetical protein
MQTMVYGPVPNTSSNQARAAVTDGVTSTSRPQTKGELQMDPTMGLAPIATISDEQQTLTTESASNVIGMSGYVSREHMQADQTANVEASTLAYPADTEAFAADVSTETVLAAVTGEEQPVAVEVLPAPETPPESPKYPVGKVDFNKPFEIFRDDDYQQLLTDAKIIAVLEHGTHRVVIAGIDSNDDEHIVLQFDLDGDDITGDWTLENLSTEPQTKFIRLMIDDERTLTADETVYDSEASAKRVYDHGDLFGIFPITIPPRVVAEPVVAPVVEGIAALADELTDDEYTEEEEHDEGDADFQAEAPVVEQAPATPPHPDAKWVNGRLIAPGQVVRFHKQYAGVRDVEVVKTRDHAYATLFVKPMDGTNPYWALNKNLR